jgi:hypothetical protein
MVRQVYKKEIFLGARFYYLLCTLLEREESPLPM